MTKFLLSLHVLAAIVAIGPITVAASMFPRYAKPPDPASEGPHEHDLRTAAFLHKICRGYAAVGIAVPVLGIATGAVMGVLGDAWLMASIVLTGVAAGVLLALVLPGQEELLDGPEELLDGPRNGLRHEPSAGPGPAPNDGPGPAPNDGPGHKPRDESWHEPHDGPRHAPQDGGPQREPGDSLRTISAARAAATKLAMTTGIFNLLWAAVVVLMIVRPGSSTGA